MPILFCTANPTTLQTWAASMTICIQWMASPPNGLHFEEICLCTVQFQIGSKIQLGSVSKSKGFFLKVLTFEEVIEKGM